MSRPYRDLANEASATWDDDTKAIHAKAKRYFTDKVRADAAKIMRDRIDWDDPEEPANRSTEDTANRSTWRSDDIEDADGS